MVDMIARLYAKERQASDAASKLNAAGFASDSVARVGPPPKATEEGAPPPEAPAPTNALERQLAASHGEKLADERWRVAVATPFGRGVLATSILESTGPLPEALPQPAMRAAPAEREAAAEDSWGPAAPLSRALGLPVLSNEAAPLSAKFGWPLLKNNPTPLSSWLGLRVLTDKQ